MTHIENPDLGDIIIHEQRVQSAMEQAAMHTVNLAVARWTSGYTPMETVAPTVQASWHAAAHNNFATWLAAGGFAQPEPEPELIRRNKHALPGMETSPDAAQVREDVTLPAETGNTCTV